jgi:hypothetical protein
MSGRDHETNHDGECFKECRECKLKSLEEESDCLALERDGYVFLLRDIIRLCKDALEDNGWDVEE